MYSVLRKLCAKFSVGGATSCFKREVESSKGVENPCVGGSIPPQATIHKPSVTVSRR